MQNQSKTKQISKGNHHNPHKNKKPFRPQFNNNNPNNKLALNQYHQIQTNPDQSHNKTQSNKLHKRKRDLERIIKHCQEKGIEVDPAKMQQLQKLKSDMQGRRKTYQKSKRKQFFLQQKYKDIKSIQLRKVYKHLGATKANTQLTDEQKKKQIDQWQKKLRYIKHFPKTLKYISLFPTSKPLEEKTLEFQRKIMADIEEENSKRVARLNYYKSENQVVSKKGKKGEQNDDDETVNKKQSIMPLTKWEVKTKTGKKHTRQVVDDFFVQQEQSQDEKIQTAQVNQPQEQQSQSQQSELDEQAEIGDQDEMDQQEEDSQDDDDNE